MENNFLNLPVDDEDSLLQLQDASVSYRIAMGPPRLNLTRFFGVFAPNSNLRAQVTASQRGKNSPKLNNRENSQSEY